MIIVSVCIFLVNIYIKVLFFMIRMNYIYVLISFSSNRNVIYVRMYVFFKNSSIWYVFSNFIFRVLIE